MNDFSLEYNKWLVTEKTAHRNTLMMFFHLNTLKYHRRKMDVICMYS